MSSSADPGPSSSSLLDTTSEFLQVLTAPYNPPTHTPPLRRAKPRPDHVEKCRATISWTSTSVPADKTTSRHPPGQLDQPIYQPHGRWAWTHGLSLDNANQLLPLRNGAQCSASIDSGTVGGKEIKYICRKWKTSKQKEWYGFYSELALYSSEQYLRPLQGDVVPHIIGVHVMPETVSITMEMPHSSFWIESSPSMPDALKERVIAAFERIHAQGVLHGDPELRHMLIGGDGKVMIIDFGMSRAVREHTSVGIERAEPEEFRLEMRKVKYKLDYKGARKKEGDKVDDYLRRVRRNRKISELWKRRAKGERVGPIPQYEEDPEEYELDPPVNAQDFQEDWITASDDSPMRVVVPGQSPEEVANEVETFLSKVGEICSACSSRSTSRPEAPCSSPNRRGDPQTPHSQQPTPGSSHSTDQNQPQLCRTRTSRHMRRRQSRHVSSHRDAPHRREDELFPLSARHIEGTSMRRDYIRHKHVKNSYISSLSSNPSTATAAAFPSSIDVPECPRSLRPEEYKRIQESRRQAMLQYSRAPRGILKRRRDDDDGVDAIDETVGTPDLPCKKLRFCEQPGAPKGVLKRRRDDEEDETVGSPCKKLRFSEPVVGTAFRGRTPFSDSTSGRRPRIGVYSRAYKRLMVRKGRPELVDFTLPSLRTLSTLVGSLMPWVRCQ